MTDNKQISLGGIINLLKMISNLQLSTYPFQKRSWNTNEGRIIRRYDPTGENGQ